MSQAPPWDEGWFESSARLRQGLLWRGVEAQHRVATLRLVDTLAEQEQLEALLEASKPPAPAGALHYLIATPFRYRSPHGSRFRAPGEPGLWYGAKELHTACAEVAYWRWHFLIDSAGLREGALVTEHTLFQARVRGRAIDLREPPWSRHAAAWTDPRDHGPCQALGRAARRHVQWLRYASVRRPGGSCAAVFDPQALSLPQPPVQQTWTCKVTATQALMVHDEDRLELDLRAAGA